MFSFFNKKPRGTGALLDIRPAIEKEKDYKFEEIVSSANPVTWVEKPRDQWRKFPIFDQNGSGSCVAQTMAKLLGIMYFLKNQVYVHFSATHIYQRRVNKPNAGMGGVDALDIARKGVTLEVLALSQKMTDSQMDETVIEKYKEDVGEVFKIGNYVQLPQDIETVASTIQTTGKGVMVWFFFKYDEWTDVPTIKNNTLTVASPTAVRHSVTAVDWTIYKGKKAIIIEDSWGEQYGLGGQRVITEDFFKARNFFSAYPITFKFEEGDIPQTPKYSFGTVMKFGETNGDIKVLQDILKFEGMFPLNVESTGYYGAITAKAVLIWQRFWEVASESELSSLQGKLCGAKTLAKLNEIYDK